MWEYQCEAERKRGGQCTRKSTVAVWCYEFQDEHFNMGPAWVEVCGHHVTEAGSIVAIKDI